MSKAETVPRPYGALGDISLFLFDLDGTLVNTMRVWNQMTITFLKKFGLTATEEEISRMEKMSFEEGGRHLRTEFGLSLGYEEFVRSWLETARELYAREAMPIPGAIETLRRLKERGARLVLFSQSPRPLVDDILPRMGLWDIFDGIFLSGETVSAKGTPEAVLEVVQAMEATPSQAAVVDDAPYAAQAAREAGVLAIGAGWMADRKEELRNCADVMLEEIEQLAGHAE